MCVQIQRSKDHVLEPWHGHGTISVLIEVPVEKLPKEFQTEIVPNEADIDAGRRWAVCKGEEEEEVNMGGSKDQKGIGWSCGHPEVCASMGRRERNKYLG